MTIIKKGNVEMAVKDKNQLAAFLNNGWEKVESVEKIPEVPAENESEISEVPTKQYSKSDISRMNTADLKTLAPTLGIEVTEESTGAKLKEEIIAKLGL